jgi:multicomponent Na+:H+ antiporter subunit C
MLDAVAQQFNYWVVIGLMLVGLYVVIANANLVKTIVGLSIFQSGVFLLFISFGKVEGGTAPIAVEGITVYSNPLPHVLILTAIVVGVATTAVALALAIRIHGEYGSLEEDDIARQDREMEP